MTACTEWHMPPPDNDLTREGQKGMPKEGTAS
jgi:hypothetical protein